MKKKLYIFTFISELILQHLKKDMRKQTVTLSVLI